MVNTRGKSNSMSNPIIDLFKNGEEITSKTQLKEKIGNADLNDILFAILVTHRASMDRVAVLENRVAELEHNNSRLEDRILRQEAYSGRNTIILGGLPEAENETPESLEKEVVSVLQVADPTIRPQDLGIVHRNHKRKDKTRSVTVVITKARNKDTVMRNRKKLEETRKVAAYHRMSEGLSQRKKILEKAKGDNWKVNWVAFSGHRLFTVNITKDGHEQYIKNVLSLEDIRI